jgi:hypothetical protein
VAVEGCERLGLPSATEAGSCLTLGSGSSMGPLDSAVVPSATPPTSEPGSSSTREMVSPPALSY